MKIRMNPPPSLPIDPSVVGHATRVGSRFPVRKAIAICFTSVVALGGVAGLAGTVHAEGEADLGGALPLKKSTEMRVDVLQGGETVTWNGKGNLTLFGANGVEIESLAPGATSAPIATPQTLKVTVAVNQRQTVGIDFFVPVGWDIAVKSAAGVTQTGRLYSTQWVFETGEFGANKASSASVYAVANGGASGRDVVIEMMMDGINGGEYQISANSTGLVVDLQQGSAATSVPDPTSSVAVPVEFPIYLNPPESAGYNPMDPQVSAVEFEGNADGCSTIVSPSPNGRFSFNTNVDGTYHIVCDTDQNGHFSEVGGGDLLLIGKTVAGVKNVVQWDATIDGQPLDAGDYDCRIEVHVGEFHFAARDVETIFAGLRMFEVAPDASRSGLPMFWNDAAVENVDGTKTGAVIMPPNPAPAGPELKSPTFSPSGGLSSGDYAAETVVYGVLSPYNLTFPSFRGGNSRAWGAFLDPDLNNKVSKGEKAVMNTFTWARASNGGTFSIGVVSDGDTDEDGCSDIKETCVMGTDPLLWDTDGDGLGDCHEAEFNDNPTNPLDPDSDGDGLCDGTMDVMDGDGNTVCIDGEDVDEDGINDEDDDGNPTETDPADEDTDDDGWCDGPLAPADTIQCPDQPGDNCPLVHNPGQEDEDGDGIGDACDDLDCDLDNDGIIDNPDPSCWPDVPGDPPSEPCVDGDTTLCLDNCPLTQNADQVDQDADGEGDVCDCDVDGDGVIQSSDPSCWPSDPEDPQDPPTDPCEDGATEGCIDNCPVTPNGAQADLDGNGFGDACDCDIDNDGIPQSSDPSCWPNNPEDPPTDPCVGGSSENCIDNCAVTPNGGQDDLDSDGIGDICDCDVDGDGIIQSSDPSCWPNNPENPPTDPCLDGDTTLCIDNCPVTPNGDQADMFGNGTGDVCDCDIDDDGIIQSSDPACWPNWPGDPPTDACGDDETEGCIDNCPMTPNGLQSDDNTDGEGDACECDRDDDGIIDNPAAFCWPDVPGDPPNQNCADGVTERCLDNCPDTVNPGQEDLDGDLEGDVCDCDVDGDGIIASALLACWPGMADVPDVPCGLDGNSEACQDNCAVTPNADQGDQDGDGIGDLCDCDQDGDGIIDKTWAECWPGMDVPPTDACADLATDACIDNCPVDPNSDQSDFDNDGSGDECDPISRADRCATDPSLPECKVDLRVEGGACQGGDGGLPVGVALTLGGLMLALRRRRFTV